MMGFIKIGKSYINSYEIASVIYGVIYGVTAQTQIYTTNGEIRYTETPVEEVMQLIKEAREECEGRR